MSARLRAIARETLDIIDAGGYDDSAGRRVDLTGAVRAAVAGTVLHLPDERPDLPAAVPGSTTVEVTAESTLWAARRLAASGPVAALVFASAKNPGGGFITGAQAQEESVARASALYPCLLTAREFYEFHRGQGDLLYSDRVIYSPRVPVFRDDKGRLLDAPYEVSFLTAAAPNRGAVLRNQAASTGSINAVLGTRADRVLEIAAAHGERRLVLGAWGCGVFKNEPWAVANAFAAALDVMKGHFDHVTFAVLDRGDAPIRAAFAEAFPPAGG